MSTPAQPFNASLTDAVDFSLDSKPPGGHRTAKELVDEFIEAKRTAGRREEYLRIQASVLGIFAKAFPDRLAHEIGASEIDEWLKARGKSLHTRRNYQLPPQSLQLRNPAYTWPTIRLIGWKRSSWTRSRLKS